MADPPISRILCPHTRLTDEDGHGHALCLDCGAAVVVRLTAEILQRQIDAVMRQERHDV